MKQLITIIFLVVAACSGCTSSEKEVKSSFDELSGGLDTYFNTLTELKKFNGGVLVQKDGEIVLDALYNIDESDQSSLHVGKNAQFDIHSISKLMAQACVVNLEKENLISRADHVAKYLPDFPNGASITIEHLIKNQSGLPRGFSYEYDRLIEKTPEEIVDLIKKESLLFEPGSESIYSNLGYELLYFIITKVTKKPFAQYVNDAFFVPLQMNGSGAHFHSGSDNLTSPVNNHEEDDGEIVVVPNLEEDGMNQARMYSTRNDLLKFIDHVKQAPYPALLTNKNEEIGWSGGGDGILSHAKASVKSGYELVFFSNYDEIPFGEILETVERIMTGQAYELPQEINRQPIELSVDEMQRFVGDYQVKEFNNDTFGFRVERDSLVFYQNGEGRTALNAESDSSFFYEPSSEDYFLFREAEDGDYDLIFNYKGMEILGRKMIKK